MTIPVCRTCFKVIENDTLFFCLDIELPEDKVDIKTKLKFCAPELNLDRVRKPVICNPCLEALNAAYDFKAQCVETETKISKYMTQTTIDTIDLDASTKCAIDCLMPEDDSMSLPNTNNIRCLVCNVWFESIEVFKKHINTHMTELRCPKCKYQTNSQLYLARHLKTHNTSVKLLKCQTCDYETTDRNSFVLHRASHSGSKVHQCKLCDFRTTVSFNFRRHVKSHKSKPVLSCDRCSYTTPNELDYQMHSKTHDGAELIQCLFCPYTTLKRTTLKRHVHRHHKNDKHKNEVDKFQVTLADVAFVLNKGDVDELLRRPDDEKMDDPDAYLVSEHDVVEMLKLTDAKVHLKNVVGNKLELFSCPVCKLSFKFKYLLQKHMIGHKDGDQVYKCDECGFSDSRISAFKLHMMSHTGGKVYSCDKCNYRTVYSTTFYKHQRMHIKQSVKKCQECDFETLTETELVAHSMTHVTNGALLRCAECMFETEHEDEMKTHLDMHTISNEFIDGSIHQHFLPPELVN